MNAGYWTPQNEEWFCYRREEIRQGKADLRTADQWRRALKYDAPQCAGFQDFMDGLSARALDGLTRVA